MNSASRKRFARTLFVHPLGKFGISTGLLLSFAVVAFCHANPNKVSEEALENVLC